MIAISWLATSVKLIRRTAAAATPTGIALLGCPAGNPFAAIPTAIVLSLARTISIGITLVRAVSASTETSSNQKPYFILVFPRMCEVRVPLPKRSVRDN